jgi:uncharacterized membrane protein YeaQ/YmgE (transglycosylase-associated protein family)
VTVGGWIGALLALALMFALAYTVYWLVQPYLPYAVGGAVLLLWARLFLLRSRRHW